MNFLTKRWYLAIPLLLLCSPLLIILYFSMTYGYSLSEAVECFKAVGKTETKFREGIYSESKFHEIQPGFSGKDVFERLGIPLERHDDDTKWCYSLPVGGAAYYHERTFIMNRGKVASVVCRFHTPQTKD
jgi:hypothetical protein